MVTLKSLTLTLIGTAYAYGGAAFGRRQGVAEPLHDGFSYLHGTATLAHAVGAEAPQRCPSRWTRWRSSARPAMGASTAT
jgi:hypothetical protein